MQMEQNINDRAKKYADELMRLYAASKPAAPAVPINKSPEPLRTEPPKLVEEQKPPEAAPEPVSEPVPEPAPELPEAPEPEAYGRLTVEARSAREALPVSGALAIVTRGSELYGLMRTDDSGMSSELPLPTPPLSENDPRSEIYNVAVHADGFYSVEDINAPAYADIESLLPVNMIPLPIASPPREIVFYD